MALAFDPALLVYTSDKKGFRLEEIKALFDRLFRQSRPIVLFVHGRGEEPEKSLNQPGFFARLIGVGKAVSKLEAYGSTVVLFSWDSERGAGLKDRTRPLANTTEGARRFASVIETLDQSLSALEASGLTHPPLTLLAHSMGTIVVQKYIESSGWPRAAGRALFTNVVLSSADVDSTGHPVWVDRVGGVERVFITVNPDDWILEGSSEDPQRIGPPLGRNPGSVLSSTATYLEIKTKAHELFARGRTHPELERFFASTFAGKDPLGGARGRVQLSQ